MLDQDRPSPQRQTARRATRLTLVAVTLTLAAGLAACGSSGSSGSGGSGDTAGGSAQTARPDGARPAGSTGKQYKICELLPVADVAELTGLPLTKTEAEKENPQVPISKCSYESTDASQQIIVTIQQGPPDVMKKLVTDLADATGDQKVPNLGDAAYYSKALGVGGLKVLYGGTKVQVSGFQPLDEGTAAKVVEAVHAKL